MSGASHLEMAHPPLLITLVSSSCGSVCAYVCSLHVSVCMRMCVSA